MRFALDSTTASKYTILFIDQKDYERLISGYSDTPLKVNPLNAELNPICHLLALLEAHHILNFRIRVKKKKGDTEEKYD